MHAGQQEGSAEQFLLNECGIEESKVDGIITAAVAWRVTPGGRQLIDRRRRSRIERNMLQCAEYLIKECGIEPGQSQTYAIFLKMSAKEWHGVAAELLAVPYMGMLTCKMWAFTAAETYEHGHEICLHCHGCKLQVVWSCCLVTAACQLNMPVALLLPR